MTASTSFPRTTPEAEGIPSAAILAFVNSLNHQAQPLNAVQGFLLLRHGSVVAEGWWSPYTPGTPHTMYSVSKSFTSTAIGFAVTEGLLTVDDSVLSFFPDDAPENPSDNLKAMQVRHLLAMNTGHQDDTTQRVWGGDDDNWPRAFLALPVEHEPGSWFVYNTAATYMLSAIITKLTGESLLDYLKPRLFAPLGIENPTWDTDPHGRSIGGSGLHITTEDIARLAQFYLQQGEWNGQQLLPAAWIAEATTSHSDNSNTQTNPDWTAGYGYQFWRCRHNAYRGDGAFGQYCLVMPEQDAVLAITSGLTDMQTVLDSVWTHLLPAMGSAPLPADPQANADLTARLSTLALPLPEGEATSPHADRWSGNRYGLPNNDLQISGISASFDNKHTFLEVENALGKHHLSVGHGEWLTSEVNLTGQGTTPIAAAGAWTSESTYEVRTCALEDVQCPIYRLHFQSDELHLEVEPNVAWGEVDVTSITGHQQNPD